MESLTAHLHPVGGFVTALPPPPLFLHLNLPQKIFTDQHLSGLVEWVFKRLVKMCNFFPVISDVMLMAQMLLQYRYLYIFQNLNYF